MSNEVADALTTASEIAGLVGAAPGPVGIVAKIASMALKAGSAIAKAGKDPVIEIQRILSAQPEVEKVHSEWDDYIASTFGATVPSPPPTGRRKTDPPPSEESVPSSFEKRETDPSMSAVTDDEDPYEDVES